ncbi:MAG: 4-hydroxy-tetrahydrodipicolinate reductase [Deltaproteobacteria bacterium]|nr:4-hydroxy-tetrahydrodipicolinate reductase [Deltaproteobacteria bacterium]
MGQALLAAAQPQLRITAAVDRAGAPGQGTPIGLGTDVRVSDDLAAGLAAADVVIDFTSPEATLATARAARAQRKACVVGTTGLGAEAQAALAELATVAPIVVAANFSLGVNLLLGLARTAARVLGDWDAEISEIHHNRKRDAPSGTALAIARAIAAGRDVDYDQVKRHSRDGDVGPRPAGEIGVTAIRGGGVIGEHTAFFFGPDERIELSHKAGSRTIFAAGAIRAAAWVVGKPPGQYDMIDVLGLR